MQNKKEEKRSSPHSSFFPKNQKGQGLSTNAIILIVLGVFILVVLIVGFTVGWDQLRDKIFPSNNVKTIVEACGTACTLDSKYDFCSQGRELKTEDETLEDVTCYYLSERKSEYGIEKCASITCDITLSEAISEEDAKEDCKTVGKIVQYLKDKKLESYTCVEEDITSPTE